MPRPHSRSIALAAGLVALLTASCSKVFLQDDGFAEKLAAGCPDENACRHMQVEAAQRVRRCQPNTVGYVRCADAEADKILADSYVAHYETAKRERAEAEREAERARRRDEAEARVRQSEDVRRDRERQALVTDLERDKRAIEACDASEPARAARRRRRTILESGSPGATVRKECSPRTEMQAVTSACKDENGFQRTCTKNVPGDIIDYVCPKSMDEEVVRLGLYQLHLRDDYPYPEDRTLGRDEDCERVRARAKQVEGRIERLGQ